MRRCFEVLLLSAILAGCEGTPSSAQSELVNDPVHQQLLGLALKSTVTAPPDASNAWADDPAAAAFGQRLFFDPAFSGQLLDGDNDGGADALGRRGDTGRVACAGCHLPDHGFSDSRSLRQQISLAAGWGKRRAPSLLDVAQSKLLMWDGRRDALYNQIFGVIESPVEMNSSRLFAAEQIFAGHRAEYETVFGALPALDDSKRFPALTGTSTGCSRLDEAARACAVTQHGTPNDQAEFDSLSSDDQAEVTRVVANAGKAIGAYERKLSCGQSRFDRWNQGDDPQALSDAEQRGARLFVGKAKCSSCHSGPFLSDEKFHNVGLRPAVVATVFIDSDDPGASVGLETMRADPLSVKGAFSDGDDSRQDVAGSLPLEGAFRTPKLRCVSGRPSFMHTAQLGALDAVVAFFDRGGDPSGFRGASELSPLGLTLDERADLVAFLGALSGPGPSPELLVAP